MQLSINLAYKWDVITSLFSNFLLGQLDVRKIVQFGLTKNLNNGY